MVGLSVGGPIAMRVACILQAEGYTIKTVSTHNTAASLSKMIASMTAIAPSDRTEFYPFVFSDWILEKTFGCKLHLEEDANLLAKKGTDIVINNLDHDNFFYRSEYTKDILPFQSTDTEHTPNVTVKCQVQDFSR